MPPAWHGRCTVQGMPRPRRQPRRERLAIESGPLKGLLEELDRLARLPLPTCPACNRPIQHYRCAKCNVCHEDFPPGGTCPNCGAKPNRFSKPLRSWAPRLPFAAEFGRDLAIKIRGGMVPSDKQVALATRLINEDHTSLPSTADRPALARMNPNAPGWKALVKLVERDAFCEVPWRETAPMLSPRDSELWRADTQAARDAVAAIVSDRTGYEVLATTADYHDALKAVAGDTVLEGALYALLESHAWAIREKLVREPTPASPTRQP